MESQLLNIEQALSNYRHLHRQKPKFGMDVLSEDFRAQDIVVLQNDGTKQIGVPVRFGFYTLILCLLGGSKRSVNQHEYTITQHTLQLLPSGTIHSFEDTHEQSEYFVILFEKSFIGLDGLMSYHDNNFDSIDLNPSLFSRVKELYEEIDAELKNKNEGFLDYTKMLLGQILLILQREKLKSVATLSHTRSNLISNQFLCLIENSFLEHKNVLHYADAIGVTSKHLSETIKEKLGKSAIYFIHKRVVKEAEYLLAYTERSIYAIAINLNFQDASQFARFFKQHKGLSPKQYRIKIQLTK